MTIACDRIACFYGVGVESLPLRHVLYSTGTHELCESLARFIPYYTAILMANHGVVTYGRDRCKAYQRMEAVEHFARIALATRQIGKKIPLDQVQIQKLLQARKPYLKSVAVTQN